MCASGGGGDGLATRRLSLAPMGSAAQCPIMSGIIGQGERIEGEQEASPNPCEPVAGAAGSGRRAP